MRKIELLFYNEIKENLENKYKSKFFFKKIHCQIKNRQILEKKKIEENSIDEEMRLTSKK